MKDVQLTVGARLRAAGTARLARVSALALGALAILLPATAGAQVQPYGTHNYGTFYNVLPPGENGQANLAQLAGYKANGSRPAHNDDQLAMYHALTTAAPYIRASQIGNFFKDATFGVPSGDLGSTESPEAGVTIVRDKRFGVPHIYGDTRAALEFGIGWATAEDRMFEIDVLRHAGAGNLASFAGGSNVSMDAGTWANEPYTPHDLATQAHYIATLPGGQRVLSDAQNYVGGINAWIKMAESNPVNSALFIPGEYAAIGQPQGPKPFAVTDIISTASLIGGQLGQGGGAQLSRALLYEDLAKRFGPEHQAAPGAPLVLATKHRTRRSRAGSSRDVSGFGTFNSFIDPNDPEAPTTVNARSFPYQTLPAQSSLNGRSIALPDPRSVQWFNHIASRSGGAGDNPGLPGTGGLLGNFPRSDSNALLISGRYTRSGHPIAVIGPQVAYWSPEILMEEDIHGPGIDADGASFPGTNVYVELGHGRDYAWSATSEGQNIIDTFAVPLCHPGGGSASINSDYYLLHGRCVRMETLTEKESWSSNLADSTPSGSVTLQTLRTAYGLVIARATVHGRPVAYTNLRSTYLHELDSAVSFGQFNNPAAMRTPRQFMRDAYGIGYTFNWFFINSKHIAYFASGANPVRSSGTDPMFPSWASYPWKGYRPSASLTPSSTTERQTSQSAHPQLIDQRFITSWNNKPAHGYDYVDGQYASVYRSQLLDNNIEHYLAHGKMSLVELINAMGNAGTQDLRGVEVLPYALKVVGAPTNARLAQAVRQLKAWVASGAHRINRANTSASGTYSHSAAIKIMDAWWPLLIRSQFTPVLGKKLLNEVEGSFGIDNLPHNHQGSAWDTGFYGIVQKDLRSALGEQVAGPLNRIYCGSGSLKRCRAALRRSLLQAVNESPQQVYPAGGGCAAGDQMCFDAIHYTSIGVFSQPKQDWVNRPTFQQVVQVLHPAP